MKHRIQIKVARPDNTLQTVMAAKRVCLPMKLFKLVFGDFKDILVLTPGETVRGVEVHEVRDEE